MILVVYRNFENDIVTNIVLMNVLQFIWIFGSLWFYSASANYAIAIF